MIEKSILTKTSYDVLPELKKLLDKYPEFDITRAEFRYDTTKGVPQVTDIENYPLTLCGLTTKGESFIIKIHMLSAGYGGTGPHDLANVLNFLEFYYEPEWIFTKNQMNQNGIIEFTLYK